MKSPGNSADLGLGRALSAPSTQAVLDAIRFGRAKTRREIATHTGLSSSIVARRVDELIEIGLLDDAELGWSTGGRVARRIRMRGDFGTVVAVELGARSATVAVCDMAGNVLEETECILELDRAPEDALRQTGDLIDETLARASGDQLELAALGMGIPGPVSFGDGKAIAPPLLPAWDGFPIRDYFQDRYGVPTWIDNDVNLMALGELRTGSLRGTPSGVVVKIGVGIGAGITLGNLVLRGAQGCAGDIGHIRASDAAGIRCRCGNVDCLEALAGGAAIGREGTAAAETAQSPMLATVLSEAGMVTAEDVGRAAQRGDMAAMQILNAAAERIGAVLAAVVNTLNPAVMVIAGGVTGAGEFFVGTIARQVYGRSLTLATRSLEIKRSDLGERSGVIGAAWLAIDGLHEKRHGGRASRV